jgi:hypothetical protein
MKAIALLTTLLLTLFIAGCAKQAGVTYGDGGGHYDQGPPPHAPAHGYRAKHRHHDMHYDSKLGAYIVLGYDDHFYADNMYFRYRDGGWQFSLDLDGHDWHRAHDKQVPYKLRKSKAGKSKKHKDHPGKGKDKDKGRY